MEVHKFLNLGELFVTSDKKITCGVDPCSQYLYREHLFIQLLCENDDPQPQTDLSFLENLDIRRTSLSTSLNSPIATGFTRPCVRLMLQITEIQVLG